ncbi:MAG: hypothetical protein LUG16_08055 [Candidatus Gastranaerophilales bacterium]|nr:hypothetical protein [Candidatus Gastranaerophilales bacterium]
MFKFFILILLLILYQFSCAFAIDYESVSSNDKLFYKINCNAWYKNFNSEDCIILKKDNSSCENKLSVLFFGNNKNLKLNSDFEFLKDSRLIGTDNKNFKFYEIRYDKGNFYEYNLTYEELQKLFHCIDVIKLSDFKNGTYTIYNGSEEKDILLYNDTDENFDSFSITPQIYSIDKNIKSVIRIPKRGNIYITNNSDKNSKQFHIKIK